MNIQLKTEVKGHYKKVMAGFDRRLFEALAPKFPKMEIVEFTGSKKGDKVHIRFLGPVSTEWISKITADEENEKEAYFIDEGVKFPPGIAYWKHKHIVQKLSEDTCVIVDDITFRGPNKLMSILLYPVIYFGFYPRKNIYKRYFSK